MYPRFCLRSVTLTLLLLTSMVAAAKPTPMQSRAMDWAAKTPAAAMRSTEALASYLGKVSSDENLQAMAIMCWEVRFLSYDYASFNGWMQGVSISASQRASDVLSRRTAVCQGYSELFAELATEMGMEAVVVSGNAKGAQYAPGDVFFGPDHAWNAVRVNGKWRLMDATWADGPSNVSEPDWFYFCAEPSQLAFSHIPSDPRWALMDVAPSIFKFQRQPMFWPNYFKLGCYDYSPKQSFITNTGKPFRIALNVEKPEAIHISASFTPGPDEAAHVLQTELKYMPWGVVLTCTLPADARGTIEVFARHLKESVSSSIIRYGVQPAAGITAL